jgi:nicotinamidase-related amidase
MQRAGSTALVIIDVQNAILDRPDLSRPEEIRKGLDETVARIAGLAARARAAGVEVIYVQHDGGPGHRLEANTRGWQLRPEIAPLPGERIIAKRSCDSFFETDLDAVLLAQNTKRLVIAGCMTQFCVDTSTRRAVSLGYDVILASDGHMTWDSGGLRFEQIIAHHNAIFDGFRAGRHEVSVHPAAGIDF